MNPLKLTLLFCFFTTVLFGQQGHQEYPGYIVKLEGDTLRGRIILTSSVIKFRQDYVKTKYQRSELADYGYYANRKFYPKPDIAPPAKESKITGTITLANGDTLHNFYIHSIRPDIIIGYFEYPNYISYLAKEKKLLNLSISEGFRDASKFNLVAPSLVSKIRHGGVNSPYKLVDLMEVNDFPTKGETAFMYAERVFKAKGGFRAYNISSRQPYHIESKATVIASFAGGFAPLATRMAEKALAEKIITRRIGGYADWIIYKNKEIYNINSAREWRKMFEVIFAGEVDFFKELGQRSIKVSDIREVLKAYCDFKNSSQH